MYSEYIDTATEGTTPLLFIQQKSEAILSFLSIWPQLHMDTSDLLGTSVMWRMFVEIYYWELLYIPAVHTYKTGATVKRSDM
jgi:hypothetical protein